MSTHPVARTHERNSIAPNTVYDLTVDGPHTFHVGTPGARQQNVLVHNCTNLVADGQQYRGLAHTLDEHVDPTPQGAIDLAKKKLLEGNAGVNGIFVDAQLAQRVTDYAVASDVVNRRNKLAKWLSGASTENYEIPIQFGAKNSLGIIYKADGSSVVAGNRAMVVLKKMPGHARGYIVLTAFPVVG